MSGGNQFRPGWLRVIAIIIVVGAGIPTGASGKNELAFTTGIATANIAWAKPEVITATLAGIAGAGFGTVRIGLKNPLSGTFHALEQAKRAGLEVLVTIPLIDGAVASKGAEPRPRDDRFFAAYGLSQIDLARYRSRLEELLAFVDSHGIPLIGLELGNELNWSGYNGDLPLSPAGAMIMSPADWASGDRARFERGLDRYRAVVDLTRATLAKYPAMAKVKLVSAGLADINGDFIRRSGATYVAPGLIYQAFAARRIFQQFDIVGIHLYEPLRNASGIRDRAVLIDTQLDACGTAAFAQRSCWITEFGTALPRQDCAPADARRIALMQPLLAYLAHPTNAGRIPMGFYYDWNDDAGFALMRCGRLTALTKLLPRQKTGDGTTVATP